MSLIHHALVLNLHQPPWNLEDLLNNNTWEAKEILYALDRIPRSLWQHEDYGRVHLSLSGTLLETLSSPQFQQRVYGIVDCGSLLWHLQNEKIINILGTGYYHPVLPLIPEPDRRAHIDRWKNIAGHVFARNYFNGFWPPEMGFSMELIPLLKYAGYRYVLVDSKYVQPVTPMSWQELRYRPHIARYNGEEIIVVVRDRELSDAQEAGMEYSWFSREVHERTRDCDFEPLVTTCTDGENGGWFRNTNMESNFWGAFYTEYMNRVRSNEDNIRPTFIDDYLNTFPPTTEVTIGSGAWNTGWHHGADYMQWTGSQEQKDAFERVNLTSKAYHDTRWYLGEKGLLSQDVNGMLENAYWHLLRAQTSCNFYWGSDWVQRCHDDLDVTWRLLNILADLLNQ